MSRIWWWIRKSRNLALVSAAGGVIAFVWTQLSDPQDICPTPTNVATTVIVPPQVVNAWEGAIEPRDAAISESPAGSAPVVSTSPPADLVGTYVLKVAAPLSLDAGHTLEVVSVVGSRDRVRVEISSSFWPERLVLFRTPAETTDFRVNGVLYTMSVPRLVSGAAEIRIARRNRD